MMGLEQLKSYLYAKLSTDDSLITLLAGVNIYDLVQENTPLPYVTYGKISSETSHQLDAQVVEHDVNFIIVARADSSLTTHNIMARLEQIFDELLDNEDLGGGYRLISADLLNTNIEQVDFNIVKAAMLMKLSIEAGVL